MDFLRRLSRYVAFLSVALLAACSSGAPGDDAASSQAALRPANVPADYVTTPYGYFHPSCIVEVQPNETVNSDGTIVDDVGNTRTTSACARPRFDPAGNDISAGQAGASFQAQPAASTATSVFHGWLGDYNASNMGALSYISATWEVPPAPAAGNKGQTVYYFNGLQGLPTTESILQPVLAYSNGHWSATSWNCCKQGTTVTGNTIAVNTGDVIAGTVMGTNCNSAGLCRNWVVQTLDQTTGAVSTLNTASWGVPLNWAFGAVQELYGFTSCNDLPASGSITFNNQIYTTTSGANARPSWNWAAPPSSAPRCGYSATNGETTLTLRFSGAGSKPFPSDVGNFSASCTNIGLRGDALTASCRTLANTLVSTSVDLNRCIQNVNGSFAWGGNANFGASCSGCRLSGSELVCNCAERTGKVDETVIDLNDDVSNCNGSLRCGHC